MIEQFVALYQRGRITYQQTSFLELTTDVEVHRIDFIKKASACIKRGIYGELAYFTEHPALLHYNYPLTTITVRALHEMPRDFLEDYGNYLDKWRNGWHHFPSWSALSYHSQCQLAFHRPHYPYKWLSLPSFIAEEIITLCEKHEVEVTRTAPVTQPKPLLFPPPFGILCIGSSYVIARDFYVSTLW